VISGSASISTRQKTIDTMGITGHHGTRKLRGRSGCVRRSTSTPAETTMNANSVPMFERSANVSISQMPAGIPTTRPAIHVLTCGVSNFGWIFENNFGSKPSRDIANQIRAWPY